MIFCAKFLPIIEKRKYEKHQSHGICGLSCIPVRRYASDKSEIVTQMLFGETCYILLKKHNSWTKIRCFWDNYEGWIDSKQITFIGEKAFQKLNKKVAYSIEYSSQAISDQDFILIPLGASLPQYDGISFKMDKNRYRFSGGTITPEMTAYQPNLFRKLALKYLKSPYLWGGRGPMGIDCSGYVQNVFKFFGIRLPRDAYQQAEHGEFVDFVDNTRLGDLAFFENNDGRIIHVGIMLEDNHIIHAHGEVRIDSLDHFGIFNKDQKKYTHQLRFIRRVVNSQEFSEIGS